MRTIPPRWQGIVGSQEVNWVAVSERIRICLSHLQYLVVSQSWNFVCHRAGGKLIAPMGGGFVSSGDGAAVIRLRGDLRTNCREMETQTRAIIADAAAHGHKLHEERIKLNKKDGKAVSIDEGSKTLIASCEWFIRSEVQ